MKKLAVIGMGYVGIPAAALFADAGFDVTGVQRRSKRSGWKIDALNDGKNPIGGHEPGLAELIERVVKEKKTFRVTDDFEVLKEMDYILIDVQTPTDENHIPRYVSLKEVSKNVGKLMKKGVLVVIESTVAPGTTDYIVKPILEKNSGMKAGEDFYLAFSYERVMVGRLIHNIVSYPRIIGGVDESSTEMAMELYSHIIEAERYPTDALTAEVAKTTENSYRDVNIAFANEVALMCESLGVDVYDVRRFVNSLPNDPSNPAANPVRNMHFPGAGVGGHCLPKDSWLLKWGVDSFGSIKVVSELIGVSRNINNYMPIHMVELVQDAFNEREMAVKGKKICVLGFAFLQNSDDTRNTPALPLYEHLIGLGAEVVVHDVHVKKFEGVRLTNDLEEAVSGVDAVVVVTGHDEYRELTPEFFKGKLRTPIMIDGRNIYDGKEFRENGFEFRGVGTGMGGR
ncbi:MAG: nucleotide sugar dehydrogenase [Thermoplasmata archaeon]|nr:nucleotide sugar dehydrogenase [Thermoplasmata archaeon]